MAHWVRVGDPREFRDRRGRMVRAEGREIAVFKLGERWFAIADACPHQGASLADGLVRGTDVFCHRHGWRFDLETGVTPESSNLCAKVYRARAEADAVLVELPDEPEKREEEPWVVFDPARHLRPRGS